MEEESSKCVNLCDKSRNFLNENNMCENKRHHEHVEMPNNFNDEESANRKRSKREYLYDTNMQDGVSEAMTSSQIDLLGISPDEHEQSGNDNVNEECSSEAGSDVSLLSDVSDLLDLKSSSESLTWIQQQISSGVNPRQLLQRVFPRGCPILLSVDDMTLWKIIAELMCEPPKRRKLPDVNTLDDVVHLLKTCSKIVVLTGAGVSVSCGIPDFRSRNGIYARLAVEYPDLPDPQSMFDLHYFKQNPRPFFKFAKEIYPGKFTPSPCHRFIRKLEEHGKLLRNYTQNIDTLEQVAGISRVIQCHGSFNTATCMVCKHRVDCETVRADIEAQVIPYCPHCTAAGPNPDAIMKPDIVFFHENLSDEFYSLIEADKDDCDLLIVIGSSLKVRPVAHIPNLLPHTVPQILINRESLRSTEFDVELLGDGDVIVSELCRRLGSDWLDSSETHEVSLSQVCVDELLTPPPSPSSSKLAVSQPAIPTSDSATCCVSIKPAKEAELTVPVNSVDTLATDSIVQADSSSASSENCVTVASTSQIEVPVMNAGEHDTEVNGDVSVGAGDASVDKDKTRRCRNVAALCPANSFVYMPPNQYVFSGAEVVTYVSDSDSCDSGSDVSDDNDLGDLSPVAEDQETGVGVCDSECSNDACSDFVATDNSRKPDVEDSAADHLTSD